LSVILQLEATVVPIENLNIDAIIEHMQAALSEGDGDQATTLLESLRRSDQAEFFSDLPPDQQQEILPLLSPENSADITNRMETRRLVEIVTEMEPDEAADLLGDISSEQAEQVLSQIDESEDIRYLLEHPDETAGGVMTAMDIHIKQNMTVD